MISNRILFLSGWKKVEVTHNFFFSQRNINFNVRFNFNHENLNSQDKNSTSSRLKDLQNYLKNDDKITEKQLFEAIQEVYHIKKRFLRKELLSSDSNVMQKLLEDNVILLFGKMSQTFDNSWTTEYKLKSLLTLNKIEKRKFYELLDKKEMSLSNRCLLVESKILALKSDYKRGLRQVKNFQFLCLFSFGLAGFGIFLVFLYFLIQYDVYYFDPKATDYHLYRFRS